jgi:hypothetical protein
MLCFTDSEKGYSLHAPVLISLDSIGKSMVAKRALQVVDKHICHRLKKETTFLFEECDSSSLLDPEFSAEGCWNNDPAF